MLRDDVIRRRWTLRHHEHLIAAVLQHLLIVHRRVVAKRSQAAKLVREERYERRQVARRLAVVQVSERGRVVAPRRGETRRGNERGTLELEIVDRVRSASYGAVVELVGRVGARLVY